MGKSNRKIDHSETKPFTLTNMLKKLTPESIPQEQSLDSRIAYLKSVRNDYHYHFRREMYNLLSKRINIYGIGPREKNIFERLEISFIYDILRPARELLEIKGFGPNCLSTADRIIKQATAETTSGLSNDVKKYLLQPGFRLTPDEEKQFILHCWGELTCPECHQLLKIQYGCLCCNNCGYSRS